MIAEYYSGFGFAIELLAHSEYHRKFEMGDYLDTEILPPMKCDQIRYYVSDGGIPTAMVTWAWLSEEIQTDIHATGRALTEDEWNCGDRLFFNDWITPYGNTRDVLKDMTHNIFPDEVATSLRRNPDSSVRRINRWTGINIRNPQHKNTASDLIEDVQSGKKACPHPKPRRQAQPSDLENTAGTIQPQQEEFSNDL